MSEDKRSEEQARAQLHSIVEMVACLDLANENEETEWDGEQVSSDDMMETIQNDALSVEVRSDWHTPGGEDEGPTEYRILLCWGGPAVQITGELNQWNEPENAVINHQDWGTPWTPLHDTTDEEDEALLRYARCFYYDA